MQRRDFSRSLMTAGALASASALTPAWAQRIGFKEGTDYQRLAKPASVAAAAGQIEVVEFFAYSCIHCYRFEPLLEGWIAKLAGDVKVRRNPVAFSPAFQPMQRLYFALESMDLVDKLHAKVFHAFHEENQKLVTPEAITAWVEKQGVDREQFLSFFNGTAIKMSAAATQLQDAYQVEGTPALGVAGRFYVGGQGPKTLVIADSLIAQVRKG
ncbi:disulfide bond formation protein DsbA [Hydrogenophaga crassostreae]|uniref:Thiol:disulfide interchange protein n=1 Tax=Hydrogenophaga crassostreae TaxID=1763535 RepID=A0A167GI63_9BURK|nr:thiol:disulfide interchange protein DsbA/DsbL [Hydrogenophaga crassostreae]AOW15029.1 disulfide bond formation protein DsbA [Hydrogenophaga crassostreae]OAD39481.1 disulfide bond formation protein DsbA [Hydrogenophaga crassostreae]